MELFLLSFILFYATLHIFDHTLVAMFILLITGYPVKNFTLFDKNSFWNFILSRAIVEFSIFLFSGNYFFCDTCFFHVIVTIGYCKYYYDGCEKQGGRKWSEFKSLLSQLVYLLEKYLVIYKIDHYNNMSVKENEIVKMEKHYIFLAKENPVFSMGSLLHLFGEKRLKNVRFVAPKFLFSIPLLRDIALWLGMIEKSSIAIKESDRALYMTIREDGYDNDEILRCIYESGKRVYPVIHKGEEIVVKHYKISWLDEYIGTPLYGIIGYVFPTIFLPQKGTITTCILPPIDSKQYPSAEQFISFYINMLESNKEILSV